MHSVKALLLGVGNVGICPGPQPGAGDGEILVAGQHQRSPVTVVTVVTTHGQMVMQRAGDKLQEFLPHSTI